MVYRYPLPDNLGFRLEVNRGNVVEKVTPGSPAEKAGLRQGDVVRRVGNVPIHSFADATYALDKAPAKGTLNLSWSRDKESLTASLDLPKDWRKTDISWRPSLRRFVPSSPFYGDDLNAAERKQLGLTDKQLAFRLTARLSTRAKQAGFQPGDIVISVDDRPLELTATNFVYFIHAEYLVGDTVHISLLRDGKKLRLPLTLTSR
jgi:serine protease Do